MSTGRGLIASVRASSQKIPEFELTVTWGAGVPAWTYTVAYDGLGATPAPVAPADPRPLRPRQPAGDLRTGSGSGR